MRFRHFPIWLIPALAALFIYGLTTIRAQTFRINSAVIAHGTLQISFSGRDDSYYILHSANSLPVIQTPIAAMLGGNGSKVFTTSLPDDAMRFYRVEQLSLSGAEDQDQDRIPDVWELQHGLNPLLATDAAQIVPGENRSWLQKYLDEIPTIAAFASSESTGLVTASLTPVTVNLSKPFSGTLRVQLGGTALFGVDYSIAGGKLVSSDPPIVELLVPSPTSQVQISVKPIDTAGITPDRIITLSLVAPVNGAYLLSGIGPVTHVEGLTETSLTSGGLFAGTLAITNAVLLEPQGLRIAIRDNGGGQLMAYFDTARARFFNSPFSLPVTQTADGLQFQGAVSGTFPTNSLPASPLARWVISFPQSSTDTNGVMTSRFRLDLIGLTASGRTNTALGTITFAPLN
jgi:hypothetical protein